MVLKPRLFVLLTTSPVITHGSTVDPKLLPDSMSKIGDYGAAASVESIFHLLEERGCEHFKAFGTHGFTFPSSESLPALSKTVDTITKIELRNFWAKSGREHARKKVADRLAKV
jgi:hypothetical protein